jgi:hypothetical protein
MNTYDSTIPETTNIQGLSASMCLWKDLCCAVENLVEALSRNKTEHPFSSFHLQSAHSWWHQQVQPYKYTKAFQQRSCLQVHNIGEITKSYMKSWYKKFLHPESCIVCYKTCGMQSQNMRIEPFCSTYFSASQSGIEASSSLSLIRFSLQLSPAGCIHSYETRSNDAAKYSHHNRKTWKLSGS